ncbi:MAG: Rdx family protein [Nitrospinota bacterium]|nr:Rdx family protein [Nitrospinota bacterium]MDH5755438.1 Rdx family protein [Nitrospinota bacterium]
MAASLAAEIRKELGLEVECLKGSRGIYEVRLDDKLIFSKSEAGDRFPNKGEVVQSLKEAGAQ